MVKTGDYSAPLSQTTSLIMPLEDMHEFVRVLRQGGFRTDAAGGPWTNEAISWQMFYCRGSGGVIAASAAIMLDNSDEPAIVAILPCRSILGRVLWPMDARLTRRVSQWLLANGARNAS